MSFKTGLNTKTFEAKAILGLRAGYSKKKVTLNQVKKAVDEAALKVEGYTFSGTITPTNIYVVGPKSKYEEPAVLVESSIYPRFPTDKASFKRDFTQFVGHLATILEQERVAIRFTDESLMVETKHCQKSDINL